MSLTLPQGEKSRRAIKWIAANLEGNPNAELDKLVLEAITRFDMNPLESEMLLQFYRNKNLS